MSQPAGTPDWNPADPGDIVEPPLDKKDLGWLVAEKPPAQFFNWFWWRTSQWVQYLKNITGEALTWTGVQAWSAISVFMGQVVLAPEGLFGTPTAADGDAARVTAGSYPGDSTATAKTHLGTVLLGAQSVSVYVTQGFDIEFAVNATWNNTTKKWSKTQTGHVALLMRLGITATGVLFAHKDDSANTAWNNTIALGSDWTRLIAQGTFLSWRAPSLDASVLFNSAATTLEVATSLLWNATDLVADFTRLSMARDVTYSKRTTLMAFGGEVVPIAFYRSGLTGNSAAEAFEIGVNTVWVGNTPSDSSKDYWQSVDHAKPSLLYRYQGGSFQVWGRAAGAGTWTDITGVSSGGWTNGFPMLQMDLRVPNPASTVAQHNSLTPKNICKAWALIRTDAVTPALTVRDGFNIASVSRPDNFTIRVNLASPFTNSIYAVVPAVHEVSGTDSGNVPRIALFNIVDESTIDVAFQTAGGTNVQINAGGSTVIADLHLLVYGDQGVA